MSKFRIIPSIEKLRQRDTVMKLETSYGHRNVIDALRKETEALRATLSDKSTNLIESEDAAKTIERNVENNLKRSLAPSLQSVINATGVIVHTNL